MAFKTCLFFFFSLNKFICSSFLLASPNKIKRTKIKLLTCKLNEQQHTHTHTNPFFSELHFHLKTSTK